MPRKYTRVFDVNDVIVYLNRGGPKHGYVIINFKIIINSHMEHKKIYHNNIRYLL